jgi:serine/threonine-protein kinase HipA
LQTGDGIRLAPFYDLLSTSVYKEIGQNFAFKIGGQNLWFKLKKRLFEKLSVELELKSDVIPKLSIKLLNDIEKHLPKLVKDFDDRFLDVKTGKVLGKEIL